MPFEKREKLGFALIAITALFAIVAVLSQGPISQDVAYHLFADTKPFWAIPNFWNVVTNLPFLIVGFVGLYELIFPGRLGTVNGMTVAYALLFAGAFLVGLGSAYYHWEPNNQTLVWDRLPMTIAFMALFSIIIGEFVSLRGGKALLFPLILAGIFSVVYWHIGEANGNGDLRPYVFVQFYPLFAIPIMLICFRSHCSHAHAYWWLLLAYTAAKLLEHFDRQIFDTLGFISGHSLKHVAAAAGIYILLRAYRKRNCDLKKDFSAMTGPMPP